jgi:hypothetical protein
VSDLSERSDLSDGTMERGGDLSDLRERSGLNDQNPTADPQILKDDINRPLRLCASAVNIKSEIKNPKSRIRNFTLSEAEVPKLVYVLRPAMIHGPGNKGNLNLLYQVVKKGIPWPLGAFENQRSFIAMDNVAFIVNRILENPVPPGIYNLADDEPLSTNEIIQLIAESLGHSPLIWNLPEQLIRMVARAGDFFHLPLNRERLKKLTENYRVSNNKIKTALGVETLPVEAMEGLMKTFQSIADVN